MNFTVFSPVNPGLFRPCVWCGPTNVENRPTTVVFYMLVWIGRIYSIRAKYFFHSVLAPYPPDVCIHIYFSYGHKPIYRIFRRIKRNSGVRGSSIILFYYILESLQQDRRRSFSYIIIITVARVFTSCPKKIFI